MSVLIRGMEMPKNCGECLLAKLSPTGESLVCNLDLSTVSWEERPFTCLLDYLPPHGDLIDRDALIEANAELADCDFIHPRIGATLREVVEDAPTIIEAEEDE